MTDLPQYCLWWPVGGQPCYQLAGFMLVRPSGESMRLTCAQHLEAWRAQMVGEYEALTLREWEARGCGYRGPALGRIGTRRRLGGYSAYAARLVGHLGVMLWDGIGRDRITVRGAQALLVCLLGCTAGGSSPALAPRASPPDGTSASVGRLVVDTIDAPAIAANLYEDPPRVPVAVYLPPSCAASSRRSYPVLYVLHGYTHTLAGEPVPNPHARWLLGPFGTVAIDSLIHLRALRELIIVVPNATSRYGAGTFYTNSDAGRSRWSGPASNCEPPAVDHRPLDGRRGGYQVEVPLAEQEHLPTSRVGKNGPQQLLEHEHLHGAIYDSLRSPRGTLPFELA